MKVVSIHQPNFFPWIGFFNKILKSDTWVVLDHVRSNPGDAAFWGRRVKILVNGKDQWFSVPLLRERVDAELGVPINRMKINLQEQKLLKNALRTIESNYKKAPHFNSIYPLLQDYFGDEDQLLANRNLKFIKKVLNELSFSGNIILSSSLHCENKSQELILEILKKMDATTYLSGKGAMDYQSAEAFKEMNVNLVYNEYQSVEYPQLMTKSFVPSLSIVDLLMNCGFEESHKIVSGHL